MSLPKTVVVAVEVSARSLGGCCGDILPNPEVFAVVPDHELVVDVVSSSYRSGSLVYLCQILAEWSLPDTGLVAVVVSAVFLGWYLW